MKSLQSHIKLLGLFALFVPSTTRPRAYYVTTETRHYVEPEISPEAWLITLITIPFVYWLSEKLAPKYVETQDDIETYSVTVKIKQRSKTVAAATFTASDYDDVIEDAIAFAQKEQGENQSLVFKPSITTSRRNSYSLDAVKKSALSSKPNSSDAYWKQIDRDLTRIFLVPPKAAAPQHTHVTHTHHHVREVEYVVVPEPRYSAFWFF